jgi:hypothetical protein
MSTQKFRIDRSFEKVYEFCSKSNTYLFFATFYQLGVTKNQRDKTILKAIQNY